MLPTRLAAARRGAVAALLMGSLALGPFVRAQAIVYDGTPDLALASAMVAAGGGPKRFSSRQLFHAVTGSLEAAEAKKLADQFGPADVANTFAVFDFAVKDVVRVATAAHVALPPPSPDPTDGKALALALYGAGITPTGKWDVGYMLEHMISHPIHHAIMHDMDAEFGAARNGRFHIVLEQMMDDLAVAYGTAR